MWGEGTLFLQTERIGLVVPYYVNTLTYIPLYIANNVYIYTVLFRHKKNKNKSSSLVVLYT